MPKQVTAAAAEAAPLAVNAPDAGDKLAGYDAPLESDDGLGGVSASDIKLANLAPNVKKLDKTGRQVPADVLYNSLDESARSEVNAVFLLRRKSNDYSRFVEADSRYERVCSSRDQVTGIMHDGTRRPCHGCPDAEWRTAADGKRSRNCSEIHRIIGVDRDSQQLFSMRFRRTSLPVLEQHLAKHHIGRRIVANKRGNYPLYAFGVKLGAKMAGPKATYALPTIEHTGTLPAEEFTMCKASSEALAAQIDQVLDHAERSDADDSQGGDASFEHGANAQETGKDFVS